MLNRSIHRWLVVAALTVLAGCPDNGRRVNPCENPNLDCNDGNACTADSCDPEQGCVHTTISCTDRDLCTNDSCNPTVGCVHAPVNCDDGNRCTQDTCSPVNGCTNTDTSSMCNDNSLCTTDRCDPVRGCVNSFVICDDGNACTAESCNSATGCASTPVADGVSCDRGLGRCKAGVCEPIGCTANSGCDDRDACTEDRCDLATNQCINQDISRFCDDGNACTADLCLATTGCQHNDISANCDDGEECTADTCESDVGCTATPVENGTVCEGGEGVCRDSVCVSFLEVEYEQSFEGLDRSSVSALGDDGWIVYGNVFEPVTDAFLYGYGPFAAPNDGAAFSAIANGEGGSAQGTQQLSVYSDYNNADHANGRIIEANVYRERPIVAADVGRTIRFSFDAKRGNINDPSDPLCPCTTRAQAFLKTLNPAAGFATTNLIRTDTTALSANWERLEVSLEIRADLVGQLLQTGFSTNATQYQPSGNFYDNVKLSSVPTLP